MKKLFNKVGFNPNMVVKVFVLSIVPILLFLVISKKDIILSIPFIVGMIYLPNENLKVKKIEQFFLVLAIYGGVTVLGTVASLNSIIGILINFVMIFSIAFCFLSNYKASFYYPIIMYLTYLEIFTVGVNGLLVRVLLAGIGVIYMFVFKSILTRNSSKGASNLVLKSNLLNIEQINGLIEDNVFNNDVYIKNKAILNQINKKVYSLKYKEYFTTNIGKIYFNWLVLSGVFNTALKELHEERKEGLDDFTKEFLKDLKNLLEDNSNYLNKSVSIEYLSDEVKEFIKKYEEIDCNYHSIYQIVNMIKVTTDVMKKHIKVYEKNENQFENAWFLPEEYRLVNILKNNFNLESLKFRFSLRLSIVLTLSLFVVSYFKMPKLFWIPITVISVTQPFFEDTMVKVWVRFKGTIIASLILVIIFNMDLSYQFKIYIGIVSILISIGFLKDEKMIIFTTICSVLFASLQLEGYAPIIYRVVYIGVGVAMAMVANKFLFPYKFEEAIEDYISKLIEMDKNLFDDVVLNIKGNNNMALLRTHMTYIYLICDKLEFYNIRLQNQALSEFVIYNMVFLDSLITLLVNYRTGNIKVDICTLDGAHKYIKGMIEDIEVRTDECKGKIWGFEKINEEYSGRTEKVLINNIIGLTTSIKYIKESYNIIFSN